MTGGILDGVIKTDPSAVPNFLKEMFGFIRSSTIGNPNNYDENSWWRWGLIIIGIIFIIRFKRWAKRDLWRQEERRSAREELEREEIRKEEQRKYEMGKNKE